MGKRIEIINESGTVTTYRKWQLVEVERNGTAVLKDPYSSKVLRVPRGYWKETA